MIVKKLVNISGTLFRKIYSDKGFYIKRESDGVVFQDVVSILDSNDKYVETDVKIPQDILDEDSDSPVNSTEQIETEVVVE